MLCLSKVLISSCSLKEFLYLPMSVLVYSDFPCPGEQVQEESPVKNISFSLEDCFFL